MDSVLVSDARRSLRRDHAATERRRAETSARPFYAIDAISRPLTEFSGDFYFSTEVRGELWFALGDFAGHGLQAAIYGAMLQEEIARAIDACEFADPAEVVATLHATVKPEFPFNRFASLVVGRMRPDGLLQLSNAGHCPPLVRRADGTVEELDSHGPVVGLLPRGSWLQAEMMLQCGDRLVLHSDGLIESTDGQANEVSSSRVVEWVREASDAAVRRHVLSRFDAFTGGHQTDDVTLMVIARR